MSKQLVKTAGWIILSVLCNFCIVFLVQLFTFEAADLLLIENHLLLLVLACLFVIIYPKYYGLIGTVIFVALLLLLMFLDHNLTFLLYNLSALLLLGAAIGTLIKKKRWWQTSVSIVLSIVVLWNAERVYGTIEVVAVAPQQKTDATRFNELSKAFVSSDSKSLQLAKDTVYLVNYTFYACKPCRDKQPSLAILEKAFANKPFKLITIHCVDSIAVFEKHYSKYLNCYHNPDEKNSLKLGIRSYPYEIIFSKSGREVRRFAGFARDAQKDYLKQTTQLIERLLKKK
ncbi:MAG: TlpA family protein disulfide reductase [Sediminibacterium sp.]